MTKFMKSLTLATLLGIVLVGCSAELPTPDLAVTPFPMGTYKNSAFEWVFEDNGIMFIGYLDNPEFPGSYTITGDQIVFTEEHECPDGEEGTYQWEFDGNALSFKVLRENCSGRSGRIVWRPWVLEQ